MSEWPRAGGEAHMAPLEALRGLLTAKYPNQLTFIDFSNRLGKKGGRSPGSSFEFAIQCDISPQSLAKGGLKPLFLDLHSNALYATILPTLINRYFPLTIKISALYLLFSSRAGIVGTALSLLI